MFQRQTAKPAAKAVQPMVSPTAVAGAGKTKDASDRHLETIAPGARPRNLLLNMMSAGDLASIRPYLERVSLNARDSIERINMPVAYAYFPEDCLMSIIARLRDGKGIEAAVIGREGMTGTAIVLDGDMALSESRVQVAGTALRIAAGALRNLLQERPPLKAHLLRYVQVVLTQTAQTALANSHLTVEKRLARWLLTVQDRVGRDEFGLTHEFLASMLGVRRPGVTVALHMLEGKHLIRSTRGHIKIKNRAGLMDLVSTSYGLTEEQYRRLFPNAGF